MKQDVFNISLPKWPCLLVVGKKVTEDQANKILLMTDSHIPDFRYASNARRMNKLACAVFGIPSDEDGDEHYRKLLQLRKRLNLVELSYLSNSMICSSFIGGPHGWLKWDGTVGCNSYNIGKWPSVSEVFSDWKRIARRFPELDLECQLLSGESCEDGTFPLVRFVVKRGVVRAYPQSGQDAIIKPEKFEIDALLFTRDPGQREWSMTIDELRNRARRVWKTL